MYIISKKKKDYYDGVVHTMGIDKTIVYNRETKVLEDEKEFPKEFQSGRTGFSMKKPNNFLNLHTPSIKNSKYIYHAPFIVGFCGKLYIGWKFYLITGETEYGGHKYEIHITYDLNYVKLHVKKDGWNVRLDDVVNYIKTYSPMDMFRSLKVPIFIYDYDIKDNYENHRNASPAFIINPNLGDYDFYTVMDSFTTFQEIQMFLGGVLGRGEKEIIEVADKYKIAQHGFDKYSFRKDKQETKRK